MRILFWLTAIAMAAQAQDAAGLWQAVLQLPGQRLRIGLEIQKKAAGYGATMVSIDQGVRIPVETITFENRALKFAIPGMSITYEGTLNEAGSEIAGTLTQGAKFPLTFKKVDKFDELDRPQTPKPPFPYDSEDLTFPGAGVTLGATLTKPKGGGPFPAVVLLTGSGPQDRDETLLGHKPFLVIADHLSRQGFAVLRTDDRGVGKSTGSLRTAKIEDLSGDAVKAVEFLKTRPDIDSKRIGLFGHSEGGLIAPHAAAASADVGFVVLMAGPAVNAEQVMLVQAEAVMKAQGVPEPMRKLNRAVQERGFAIARKEADPAAFEKLMAESWAELKGALPEDQKRFVPLMEQSLKQGTQLLTSPLIRQWLDYDPTVALHKLKIPVLAVNGELDLQVLVSQNLPVIAESLAKSGSRDWAVVTLPKLNHLFQTARTGGPQEYGSLTETLSPVFLDTVTQWLKRVAGVR